MLKIIDNPDLESQVFRVDWHGAVAIAVELRAVQVPVQQVAVDDRTVGDRSVRGSAVSANPRVEDRESKREIWDIA